MIEGAKEMEIRKATLRDHGRIMEIYAAANGFMAANGNPNQWKGCYPPSEMIISDIERGELYLAVSGEEILAVFFYKLADDPTYAKIYDGEWKKDSPYGVIHRIAVAENAHGKGVSAFCFEFAYSLCGNIRIDTHRDNLVMQKALKKSGFEYCGIIYLANGEERLAYQKA